MSAGGRRYAILPSPIFSRFTRSSLPFPSLSDACHADNLQITTQITCDQASPFFPVAKKKIRTPDRRLAAWENCHKRLLQHVACESAKSVACSRSVEICEDVIGQWWSRASDLWGWRNDRVRNKICKKSIFECAKCLIQATIKRYLLK